MTPVERAATVSWFLASRLALVIASALVAATVNDVVEIGFEHRAWADYVPANPVPTATPCTEDGYVASVTHAGLFGRGEGVEHAREVDRLKYRVAVCGILRVPETCGPADDAAFHAIGEGLWEVHAGRVRDFACEADILRIIPVFSGGTPMGFRIAGAGADSTMLRLGFRVGDVIYRVNDLPLMSPEEMLRAYELLRNAPLIQVDFLRDGQARSITFRVDP